MHPENARFISIKPKGVKDTLLVTVKALEGKIVEQKRELVKHITEAVVQTFKVEPESVTVDTIEYSGDNFTKAGKLSVDH